METKTQKVQWQKVHREAKTSYPGNLAKITYEVS